jgi:glutaredoxin
MRLGPFSILFGLLLLTAPVCAAAQEALFEISGPPDSVDLPDHAVAAQNVRVNRRALQSPRISIDLFGETRTATRTHIDRQKAGVTVWTGYLDGYPADSVVLVIKGNTASGFIQHGLETYRISAGPANESRLYMLDLRRLPPDDIGGLPDGGGALAPAEPLSPVNTVQDLLVVYNQAACDSADASGDCAQLEADIVTAVADINAAYAASGIDITMNLVGTHKTVYTGTNASQTLSDRAGTSDGYMDEVHGVRDSLGADIVSMVYDGQGCGIGYLNSGASTAFNVSDEPCLVGNRTMAHEIGHNQGAHHDRQTLGGGTPGAYN